MSPPLCEEHVPRIPERRATFRSLSYIRIDEIEEHPLCLPAPGWDAKQRDDRTWVWNRLNSRI
jgi:hypothetical protein